MIAVFLLVLAGPVERALADADVLAAEARAAPDEKKAAAVERALKAYGGVIELRPKDMKLVPRVRRRRASLLKHAGRPRDALAEYDAILDGRARRKDRARALYDGARILERAQDLGAAERRLVRVFEDYKDITNVRAKAALLHGKILETTARPREAERAYRMVVKRCRDETKAVIRAYDALALLAVQEGRPRRARRWLRACVDRYEKRAARGDRYGRFVARLLKEMRAPAALAEAASAAAQDRDR